MERRKYECRLQRQMLLQKEVKELPKIVRDLITLISDYEKEKGSIYINGEHFIDILRQEEDELRPRSVRIDAECDSRPCLLCIRWNRKSEWDSSEVVYYISLYNRMFVLTDRNRTWRIDLDGSDE